MDNAKDKKICTHFSQYFTLRSKVQLKTKEQIHLSFSYSECPIKSKEILRFQFQHEEYSDFFPNSFLFNGYIRNVIYPNFKLSKLFNVSPKSKLHLIIDSNSLLYL